MIGIALSLVLLMTAVLALFTAAVFADGRLSATASADSDQRVFAFHPEDGIPQIGTCKKHNGIEGWDCEHAMEENGVERQLYRNFGCVYTNPVSSSDSSLDDFTLGKYISTGDSYFAGETTKKGKYTIAVLIDQPHFKIQFYVDGKYIGTSKGTKGEGMASNCYWAFISEMADKKLKKKMRKAIRNWKETHGYAQIEIKAVVIPTGESIGRYRTTTFIFDNAKLDTNDFYRKVKFDDDDSSAPPKGKTIKASLYKGESIEDVIAVNSDGIKSGYTKATLKSSNKSILTIKRKTIKHHLSYDFHPYDSRFSITSKKIGTTTLTLKYKKYKNKGTAKKNTKTKYKITVKDWPVGSEKRPITLHSGSTQIIKSLDGEKQINLGLTIYKNEEAKEIVKQLQPEQSIEIGSGAYYYPVNFDLEYKSHKGPERSFYLLKYDYNIIKGFYNGKYAYLQNPIGKIRYKNYEKLNSSKYDIYYMVDRNYRYTNGDAGTFYVGLFLDNNVKEFYGYDVLTNHSNRDSTRAWDFTELKEYVQLDGCIKTVLP
jgi:hypothetical protein